MAQRWLALGEGGSGLTLARQRWQRALCLVVVVVAALSLAVAAVVVDARLNVGSRHSARQWQWVLGSAAMAVGPQLLDGVSKTRAR
jgi:hypothetical protein